MDLSFSNLWSCLMISVLGTALFLYGKKAGRPWPLVAGIAMCIYPFFISDLISLWLLTVGVLTGLYLVRQRSAF